MPEGKPQLLDRHRWILPVAILSSVVIVWLLDEWWSLLFPIHRLWEVRIWKLFLPHALWVLLFLAGVRLAGASPRRRLLGWALIAVGACTWGITLKVAPSALRLYPDTFVRWVLTPYIRYFAMRPYNLNLALALPWIGLPLLLPASGMRSGTGVHRGCGLAWLSTLGWLIGIVGVYVLSAQVLPEMRYYSSYGGGYHYSWFSLNQHEVGILATSITGFIAWIKLPAVFTQNRWTTLPWILVGLAGLVVIAGTIPHSGYGRLAGDIILNGFDGEMRFFDLTARILWIGVLGFLVASWRRARGQADVGSAAPLEDRD